MSLARPYGVGLRNVGSYQVSGQPYVTGSVTSATHGSVLKSHYTFPYVTKKITLTNKDTTNGAIVSFVPYLQTESDVLGYENSASGSGNWLYLSGSTSIELDVKCKEIFVATYEAAGAVDYIEVYAELTNIPTERMYSLDGVSGSSV
jgi:hypothetical protein